MSGIFISFEGIDGAGKSTHIDGLAQAFRAQGRALTLTREPGGTPLAERIRQMVDAFNIPRLEMEGFEADDVLGSIAKQAAAQGLGIAIMHDDHFTRAHDDRLARLYDIEVASPYSYWFVCRPRALETRPVRLFHDWLVKAGL